MSRDLPKVCVVTHSPSPYQVELFDAVAGIGELELQVIYLYACDPERHWQRRAPRHEHIVYDEGQIYPLAAKAVAADLVVINYFKHPLSARVMKAVAKKRSPWVFWGERPRRHALEWVSRISRLWRLRVLHQSRAPIWGIGGMAVAAYRAEFGTDRPYVNLPYFSDLKRFAKAERKLSEHGRVVLFSGSLIPRKGVDLVAAAFANLVKQGTPVQLKIMGTGELETSLRDSLRDCMDQVEFLGFKDWQDLPAAYAEADVLCVPSRYDGWGLVVPEGLAAGLPVISTTQTGAAVEFIESGRNGWLVPRGDETALLQAMRDAVRVSETRFTEMSDEAVRSVKFHQLEDGARAFIAAVRKALTVQ